MQQFRAKKGEKTKEEEVDEEAKEESSHPWAPRVGMQRARAAGAAVGAVAAVLSLAAFVALVVAARGRPLALAEEHEWKPYQEPSNVFDDFDNDFKQGEWREYKAPSNVFDQLPELANADHQVGAPWPLALPAAADALHADRQWEANVMNDENVFDEIPDDRYPFNPTANGHEWKKWDEGDSSSERIKEMNVMCLYALTLARSSLLSCAWLELDWRVYPRDATPLSPHAPHALRSI